MCRRPTARIRWSSKLYATLRYVEDGLPDELKPLLYPLGLHEGYVDADYLAQMAGHAGQPYTGRTRNRPCSGWKWPGWCRASARAPSGCIRRCRAT